MDTTTLRRDGIVLDPVRFDFELARRGITAADLAAVAGVHEVSLSRARHGARIREATLRKLATALTRIPVIKGADAIIAAPETLKDHREEPDRDGHGHAGGNRHVQQLKA